MASLDILTANDPTGRYPPSWYAASARPSVSHPGARGDLSCDVCVVGGGYTGLSAALHLAQHGFDVILLEAHRVAWGASGRNGGQAGTGQTRDQNELEQLVGRDHARRLWDLSLQAVGRVRQLIEEHHIECDLSDGIIHADHRQRFVADTHRYADKLTQDYQYDLVSKLDAEALSEQLGTAAYYGGMLDLGGAHLHPLDYAQGLARAASSAGARLFEGSRVTRIDTGKSVTLSTAEASVRARYLVLGCNGYLGGLQPHIAARVMPINNYIVATEPFTADEARALIRNNHAVADSRFVVNYFRLSRDHRLLFGGGESYGYRFPGDIASLVRKRMLGIYPQLRDARIDYAWGGTLGITLNRLPHFHRMADNALSASGFSGHGVAMATLAGQLSADAIAGQAGDFDVLATLPTPRFPGGSRWRSALLVLGMSWYALRDRL